MCLIEAYLDIEGKSADTTSGTEGQEGDAALDSTKRTGARM